MQEIIGFGTHNFQSLRQKLDFNFKLHKSECVKQFTKLITEEIN